MAGDWLKIEANTPDKPEVLAISDSLGIHPTQAFGCLFMVWRWFDQHTVEGNAASVTKITVDRLSGISGFADEMVKVGWLIVSADGSISLPNFDRHCGETAKQRALGAKRAASHRGKSNAKSNDCSVTDALPREEKRREENKAGAPKATRLPADWVLPKDWGNWALDEKPEWTRDDILKIADDFRDYWIAKAGKDACKLDWLATWRKWVRNSRRPS